MTRAAITHISIEGILACPCGNHHIVSIGSGGAATDTCPTCANVTQLTLDGDLIWVAEALIDGVPEDARRLNSGTYSIGSTRLGLAKAAQQAASTAAKAQQAMARMGLPSPLGRVRAVERGVEQ